MCEVCKLHNVNKYENNMKIKPQHEQLQQKFPRGLVQVGDYDTFLIY